VKQSTISYDVVCTVAWSANWQNHHSHPRNEYEINCARLELAKLCCLSINKVLLLNGEGGGGLNQVKDHQNRPYTNSMS